MFIVITYVPDGTGVSNFTSIVAVPFLSVVASGNSTENVCARRAVFSANSPFDVKLGVNIYPLYSGKEY